jgi:hypothetical protein
MFSTANSHIGRLARGCAALALWAGVALSLGLGQGAVAGTVAAMDVRTHGGTVHAATSSSNLIDNGGKVLAASNTYAIFWGSASAWNADVQPGIAAFFGGLSGSSFLNTGTQYMRNTAISSTFKGARFDLSAPPRKVSPSTLGSEIQKIYGASLDANGIYFLFTSNFPKGGGFCAWHSLATVGGQPIAVAYMPNTTGVAGCDPGNLYNLSGSEGLRSLANVTSHEFMEAITDPLPANGTDGWKDSSGSEIGDKCAWVFFASVTLSNNSVWQLQEEWSNAVSGCVQTS